MKRNVIFYSRMVLFLLGFVGVYLEITKHGGFGMLMYYTVLSNIIVTAFTASLANEITLSDKGWCDHVYHDYLCHLSFYACSFSN